MIPLQYNIRSLTRRKLTTLTTALGIGLVVFVFASALMLAAGIERTMASSGRPDTIVVLQKGSTSELSSTINASLVNVVLTMPGIKSEGGTPLATAEIVAVMAMDKVGGSGIANVQIRGVGEEAMKFRPEIKVVAGRVPKPGTDEVMIGQRIRGRFKGLELDQSFEVGGSRRANVVGVFSAGGSSQESEIWAGRESLSTWFHRDGVISSIRLKLESDAALPQFEAAVEKDKRLLLIVKREDKFYEQQSEETTTVVTALGAAIAIFFSVAAMIGALITMYSAVGNRQREVGTLRALGFSRFQILASFLMESFLLAMGGGLLGAIGSLLLGFVELSIMNYATWSEMVFTFQPSVGVIGFAITFAGTMGILGGFLPAIRASRISPIEAMRA